MNLEKITQLRYKLSFKFELLTAYISEWDGVLQGMKKHRQSQFSQDGCHSELRRSIHRLEKGLCYPEQKKSYAEGYIGDTIVYFTHALTSLSSDQNEIKWASSVLAKYFDKMSNTSNKTILKAQKSFNSLNVSNIDPTHTPYAYNKLDHLRIPSAEDFMALCQKRVSCRWFTPEKIPNENIEYCINAASQAASACNRQPFRFIHITSPELKKKVVNLPLGTKGFGNDLPHLIVVVGDWSCFKFERDRHLIFIDASLATSQFLLALVAQGYAGVPINWPDIKENNDTIRESLSLEAYEMPIMLIGFGKPLPDAQIPFSEKKSVKQLLFEQ